MGRVGTQCVTILIDMGSTHNFLDPTVLKKVKLPFNLTKNVRVRVASGEIIPSEGKCMGVKLKIQGTIFLVDVHVVFLEGCDMVLSIQWLQDLGIVYWDF